MAPHDFHREIHYWAEGIREPPCGTLEDRFDWSDAVDDVTCDACRQALSGDGGDLASRDGGAAPRDEHPAP